MLSLVSLFLNRLERRIFVPIVDTPTSFAQLSRDKRLTQEPQQTQFGIGYAGFVRIQSSYLKKIFFERNQNQPTSRPDPSALAAIENTTPVKASRSSSVTQPIPVPTQAQNFEKMQETRERSKTQGIIQMNSPSGSPSDGTSFDFQSQKKQPMLI